MSAKTTYQPPFHHHPGDSELIFHRIHDKAALAKSFGKVFAGLFFIFYDKQAHDRMTMIRG